MVKCPTILSVDDALSTTCLWSVMYNEGEFWILAVSAENYSDLEWFKNMTEKILIFINAVTDIVSLSQRTQRMCIMPRVR